MLYACDNCKYLFESDKENVVQCPDCGKKIEVFGQSKAKAIAAEYGIPAIARMPLDPEISKLADAGRIEDYDGSALEEVFAQITNAK